MNTNDQKKIYRSAIVNLIFFIPTGIWLGLAYSEIHMELWLKILFHGSAVLNIAAGAYLAIAVLKWYKQVSSHH